MSRFKIIFLATLCLGTENWSQHTLLCLSYANNSGTKHSFLFLLNDAESGGKISYLLQEILLLENKTVTKQCRLLIKNNSLLSSNYFKFSLFQRCFVPSFLPYKTYILIFWVKITLPLFLFATDFSDVQFWELSMGLNGKFYCHSSYIVFNYSVYKTRNQHTMASFLHNRDYLGLSNKCLLITALDWHEKRH